MNRSECVNGPRPCEHRGCRYHLDSETDSCALDVAERGGLTLQQVGELLGCTRERVRQIEAGGLAKVLRRFPRDKWESVVETLRDLGRRAA